MYYRAGCFSLLFFTLVFSSLSYACEPQFHASVWKRGSGDKPGVDLGYLHCHNDYFRSFVALSSFSENGAHYYGSTLDLRLQPSWGIAPYVALGGTVGLREHGDSFLSWKGSMFAHYSLGLSMVRRKLGLTYALSEVDERGDRPGDSPVRHLIGLIYEF